MKEYQTIKTEKKDGVAQVILNRAQIHNAFNETMIKEIIDVFSVLNNDIEVRVILLKGEGKSFCAGADLNWMRDVSTYSYEENLQESKNLSHCFYSIYNSSKPCIAIAQGAVIGGANGLLAACDIAVAETHTVFSLSEVKIGIVPACISPYVVKRIGEYNARELMITGSRFKSEKAKEVGLINFYGTSEEVNAYVESTIASIKTSGPEAVTMCKHLLNELSNNWTLEEAKTETAVMIAKLRQSNEGQEGMDAFLNKRKPNWVVS